MTASYSSFLSSNFYSPVFNTALFDGPFRFYFSQSYESAALKMYHYLQTERKDLWLKCKKWSESTKEHIFVLIYPEPEDVKIVFEQYKGTPIVESWADGYAIGLHHTSGDEEISHVVSLLESLVLSGTIHEII